MRFSFYIIASCLFTFYSSELISQKVGKFGSSIEKKIGPKKIRVPYTDVISYLGYAEPGSEDAIVGDKKYTYLYLWIPAVAPEIGIRMISPADGKKNKSPIKAPNYNANSSSKDFFDTYITLEKSDLLSLEDINASKIEAANRVSLKYNDDSSKLPKQADGRRYNSLFRYQSDAGAPLKALSIGLYRIGFTTFKRWRSKVPF